jgi:dihydroorotase
MELSYKEDFTSGTSAAAAGGFTTVLDMPNTLPHTDSAKRLNEKAERASRRVVVNLGFHVAAVEDSAEAQEMKAAGAFSMKLYLPNPIAPLDVEDDRVIGRVLEAGRRSSLPVTIHAEDPTEITKPKDPKSFHQMIRGRTENAETRAVSRILRLHKQYLCKVHFCHISLPSSIRKIWSVNDNRLSSEVTPHHTLLSEDSVDSLSWKAWMAPPLRPSRIMNRLFGEMANGRATIIASDHAPHTIKEKRKSPSKSPPGIPGLETTLPLMLTMINKEKLSLRQLVFLISQNPAQTFGLGSKGKLERGADGDLVLVDMKKRARIDPNKFFSRAHYSPFEGWETRGAVHKTIVNGEIVYSDGEIVAKPGRARVLRSGIMG